MKTPAYFANKMIKSAEEHRLTKAEFILALKIASEVVQGTPMGRIFKKDFEINNCFDARREVI